MTERVLAPDDEKWAEVFKARGLPDPAGMSRAEFARVAEGVARWPLDTARAVADQLVGALRPACRQVLATGGVRRCQADVPAVEVLAEPYALASAGQLQLGEEAPPTLDGILAGLMQAGQLAEREGNSVKARKFWRPMPGSALRLRVDVVVVVPPAQWGLLLAVRTGPLDYVQWVLGRAAAANYQIREGALWRFGKMQPTPTEDEFFRVLGMPWETPEYRHVGQDRINGGE